jgi:hypothetical protein
MDAFVVFRMWMDASSKLAVGILDCFLSFFIVAWFLFTFPLETLCRVPAIILNTVPLA